jgi:hypothetical protein
LEGHIKKIVDLCIVFKKLHVSKDEDYKINKHFNIILAASDLYYRENFHSDIIAYILNHKNEYVKYFINYLNIIGKTRIDIENYSNPIINREEMFCLR